MAVTSKPENHLSATPIAELKQRSVRGGLVSLLSQGGLFVLQTGTAIVLARILSPEDFGLQGMVFVIVGFLNLFRDAGLSVASIQQQVLTPGQISTLFWINVAVGALLTTAAIAMAPVLAAFYKEPRLLSMTIASAPVFFLNGLAMQHRALLGRAMRFTTMAKIDILALVVSATVGVGMALQEFGYWSLVGMAVSGPIVSAAAAWIAVPWIPGRPTRAAGVDSMLRIGGNGSGAPRRSVSTAGRTRSPVSQWSSSMDRSAPSPFRRWPARRTIPSVSADRS